MASPRPDAAPKDIQPERDLSEFAGSTLVVTGGSGFLGHTLLRRLTDVWPGRLINIGREPRSPIALRLEYPHRSVTANLHLEEDWLDLLAEADYVVWLAALRDHTASAPEVFQQNVAPLRAAVSVLQNSENLVRFVYASTISALDQPPYPARPQPITDDRAPHPRTPYGASKRAAELILATSRLPHTILRLPFLYGPGYRSNSFLDFYQRAARSRLLGAATYTANLSLLATQDFSGLLLAVLAHHHASAADQSPYVVSDGHVYEVDDLVSMVAELHGYRRPRVRIPARFGRGVAALAHQAARQPGAFGRKPGKATVLGTYWSHAAFTRNYFVVDSTRFLRAFPEVVFSPIRTGLKEAMGAQ